MKIIKRFEMGILLLILLVCFAGCGKKSIDGTYVGDAESILTLNSDGTCDFISGSSERESTGEWHMIEDNELYIQLENWNYSLNGKIDQDGGFLLKSDDSFGYWSNEYFTKQ